MGLLDVTERKFFVEKHKKQRKCLFCFKNQQLRCMIKVLCTKIHDFAIVLPAPEEMRLELMGKEIGLENDCYRSNFKYVIWKMIYKFCMWVWFWFACWCLISTSSTGYDKHSYSTTQPFDDALDRNDRSALPWPLLLPFKDYWPWDWYIDQNSSVLKTQLKQLRINNMMITPLWHNTCPGQ